MSVKPTHWLFALLGGTVGGAIGYYLFFWITKQNLYPMVLPGALVGLGCGALSGTKSNAIGIVCGLSAVLLGLFIEWQFSPFRGDKSLGYFLTHVHQLKPMTLIMISLGGLFGYWFGRGREGGVWLRGSKQTSGNS
jgi:hypothetical protein